MPVSKVLIKPNKASLGAVGLPILGTSGTDALIGTSLGESIVAGIGDDRIDAKAGNDTVSAGSGGDLVFGDEGNDSLTGDAGNDTLHGGIGADQISGGSGDDSIYGGAGSDKLSGDTGDDAFVFFSVEELRDDAMVAGGQGRDAIVMVANGDTVVTLVDADFAKVSGVEVLRLEGNGRFVVSLGAFASSAQIIASPDARVAVQSADPTQPVNLTSLGGDAVLTGGSGNDTLSGGNGNDQLTGGGGADLITGSRGNDTLTGGAGADTIDGNAGTDTYVAGDGTAISLTLNTSVAVAVLVGGGAADLISNIENVVGTNGNDSITGDATGNLLQGLGGDDLLNGGGGNDTLIGGTGADNLTGGLGNDIFIIAAAADHVAGEAIAGGVGSDTIRFTSLVAGETLTLTAAVTDVDNVIDLVIGGAAGLTTGTTALNVNADALGDSLAVNLTGNGGANVLTGNASADTISGGAGNDTLNGGVGNDILNGGDGSDNINGGAGADRLIGGNGDDVFIIAAASEYAAGESIAGGAGSDTIRFTSTAAGETLTLTAAVTDVDNVINVAIGNAAGLTTGTTALNVNADALGDTLAVNLTGNDGANVLVGNTSADTINGGAGNDAISGGDGNDIINGGAGLDSLIGGNGDDLFVILAAADHALGESIAGGLGSDTIRFSSLNAGQTLALTSAVADVDNVISVVIADSAGVTTGTTALNVNADALGDTLAVNLTGNNGANALTGNATADTINGGGGNDTINGGGGDDTLTGGAGADAIDGGAGSDTYVAGDGSAIRVTLSTSNAVTVTVAGGTNDSIRNIENVVGTSGNDTITGDSLGNILYGLAGNDTINGGFGNDTIFAGAGVDIVNGGFGADRYILAASGDSSAVSVGAGSLNPIALLDENVVITGEAGDVYTIDVSDSFDIDGDGGTYTALGSRSLLVDGLITSSEYEGIPLFGGGLVPKYATTQLDAFVYYEIIDLLALKFEFYLAYETTPGTGGTFGNIETVQLVGGINIFTQFAVSSSGVVTFS